MKAITLILSSLVLASFLTGCTGVDVFPTGAALPTPTSTPVLTIRRPVGTPIRLTITPLQTTPSISLEPLPTDYTSPAIETAKNNLAKRLNISAQAIQLVSVEEVEWRDGCLGVYNPDLMCTQVITPGFKIILQADGVQYEYHTNASGSHVILVPG